MKINLWFSYRDGMDGSHSIKLHNTKEDALERLNRSEEEVKQGNIYDDGYFEEITLEIDEQGKLVKEVYLLIE